MPSLTPYSFVLLSLPRRYRVATASQCDNWLRARNIIPIPTYDTAGSAKMLKENKNLPEGCTPENTAAIASDLGEMRSYVLRPCVLY